MNQTQYIVVSVSLFVQFLFGTWSFSQQNKIDSLLILLKKDKEDTNKVNHLNDLCWRYGNIASYDSAFFYSHAALELAQKINFKNGIAQSFNETGIVYYFQGDFSKSIDCFLKALKIADELENKNIASRSLGNLAVLYDEHGDYSKALNCYLKSLKIAEELKDMNRIGIQVSNIGILYYELKDYSKALDYCFRALKIGENVRGEFQVNATGNIGMVYYGLKDYPKALDYYLRALNMDEVTGNKSGIAIWMGSIGSLYSDMMVSASADKKEKLAVKAESYLLKALDLSKEIGALNRERQTEESLSELYIKTNRFQQALVHYKNAIILKDSLFSVEKNKEITRKEMTYEFEKKEAVAKAEIDKEKAVAEAEKREQEVILYSVIGGLAIVLLFVVFIFRTLRNTRKQKQLIEQQKHLVEEKQKEILDSIHYARRIQTALLPTDKYIDKSLKRLNKF